MPVFGDRYLHQIGKADILEFRAQLAEKHIKSTGKSLSPKTINEIMGCLKAILTEAAYSGEVDHRFWAKLISDSGLT